MSVVGFTLRLAGDVSSFTASVQSQIKSATAAKAGVDTSAVQLTISPGSVIISVRILTPTATAASVQSTMATATSTTSSATAMFATVTSVSIAVLAVVTPPTIANVAPPPPPSEPRVSITGITKGGFEACIEGLYCEAIMIAVVVAVLFLVCVSSIWCWCSFKHMCTPSMKSVTAKPTEAAPEVQMTTITDSKSTQV